MLFEVLGHRLRLLNKRPYGERTNELKATHIMRRKMSITLDAFPCCSYVSEDDVLVLLESRPNTRT